MRSTVCYGIGVVPGTSWIVVVFLCARTLKFLFVLSATESAGSVKTCKNHPDYPESEESRTVCLPCLSLGSLLSIRRIRWGHNGRRPMPWCSHLALIFMLLYAAEPAEQWSCSCYAAVAEKTGSVCCSCCSCCRCTMSPILKAWATWRIGKPLSGSFRLLTMRPMIRWKLKYDFQHFHAEQGTLSWSTREESLPFQEMMPQLGKKTQTHLIHVWTLFFSREGLVASAGK